MGREVKRVSLDFKYPHGKMIWKGYHNPYYALKCECCDGRGTSKEYQEISDSWYNHLSKDGNGWGYNLTQDDVQALLDADRLWDFTRIPVNDEQIAIVKASGHNSWLPFNNNYIPTAQEVNEWAKKGLGHDSQNQWICSRERAKKMGIEINCPGCDGDGEFYPSDEYRELAENFTRIEPPSGDGYQLWSTTTDGTPYSPVFSKPEELAEWLVGNKISSFGYSTETYETWLKFINGQCGSGLSMVYSNGELTTGVAFE